MKVKALRDVDAVLNGTRLRAGTLVEATLEDKIVFHNDSELDLLDLRRRARALGGRFQLKASKSEYLVSNNPSLLEAGRYSALAGNERRCVAEDFLRLRQAHRHARSARGRPSDHGRRCTGATDLRR